MYFSCHLYSMIYDNFCENLHFNDFKIHHVMKKEIGIYFYIIYVF